MKVFTTLPLKKRFWGENADFFGILTVFSDFFSIKNLITNKDPIDLGKAILNIFKHCVPP